MVRCGIKFWWGAGWGRLPRLDIHFSSPLWTTSYKANVENSRMQHFIKINSNLILNAITRSDRRSTFERRMLWYKKKDVLTRFLCKRRRKNNTFDNFTQFENNEINNYFVVLLIKKDEKTSNVIEYWKNQKTQYSLLVKMTKNVLAIFCSNVEIKRFFNFARNVIIYKRKRLNFQTIEIVMMIKYNLNNEKLNDSLSSPNEFFVDEFSSNASRALSFVLIENDASSEQINENFQANDTALIE